MGDDREVDGHHDVGSDGWTIRLSFSNTTIFVDPWSQLNLINAKECYRCCLKFGNKASINIGHN